MLTHDQHERRRLLLQRIAIVLAYAFAVGVVFLDIVVWRP